MKRLDNLKSKILTCLSDYPDSRNSDILLTTLLWTRFYSKFLVKLDDGSIAIRLKNLEDVPSQDDIRRIRAMIQNTEKKFQPTIQSVINKRQSRRREYHQYGINNKYNKSFLLNSKKIYE